MEHTNLKISVFDNQNQGVCAIADHFEENWKTGIKQIDEIETFVDRDADADGIQVIDKTTGEVVFELEGQKALLLNELSLGLQNILGIEVTK